MLEALRTIAPVRAVRGNNDEGPWALELPADDVIEVGAHILYVIHDLQELHLEPAAAGFTVVLSGHSHRPLVAERAGVLFVNPGSAGPRRFSLPVTLARLVLAPGYREGRIIDLAECRDMEATAVPRRARHGLTRRRSRGEPGRASRHPW